MVAAWALAGLVATGLATALGQQGAWMGAVSTLAGVGAGLTIVLVNGPKPVAHWILVQIMSSLARMLVGMGAAFVVYLAARPDRYGYWGVVLATLVATLAVEVSVFLPLVRAAGGPMDGPLSEAEAGA